ncbi:MAG: GIY-YIG nuclease family protein [Candidatus Aenigmatarchaeota archaeon]
MKGTYLLLLECLNDCEIEVGKLGKIRFKKGYYVYIGSSMNNLEKRILRHLKKDKKIKWHIDYLTTNDSFIIRKIFIKESNKKEEEKISKIFEKYFIFIKNFGNSDCKDNSHLFLINNFKVLYNIIKKLNFKNYNIV